jgi:hypothetical protein
MTARRVPQAALALLRRPTRVVAAAAAWDEKLSAFPSWFLKLTCDRCGKVGFSSSIVISLAEPYRHLLAEPEERSHPAG